MAQEPAGQTPSALSCFIHSLSLISSAFVLFITRKYQLAGNQKMKITMKPETHFLTFFSDVTSLEAADQQGKRETQDSHVRDEGVSNQAVHPPRDSPGLCPPQNPLPTG